MIITATQLLQIMPTAKKRYSKFLPYLNKYMEEFEITTRLRVVYFLATIAVESGELQYTEEIADGSAYEGRKDLGNTVRGDGKRFKGRGLIQLTGRGNYTAYKKYCGFDVVAMPYLLSKELGATRSACWFWHSHGLNQLADNDDAKKVRKRVNGGYNGFEKFEEYVKRAKKCIK